MTPGDQFVIRNVVISPEGMLVEYMTVDRDVRKNGLSINHVIFIPRGEDYDDGMDEVAIALRALLVDALEDMNTLPPVDPRKRIEEINQDIKDEGQAEDEPDFDPLNYPVNPERPMGNTD